MSTFIVLFPNNHRNLPLVCSCIILGFRLCAGKSNSKQSICFALNHFVNLNESLVIPGLCPRIYHCGCRGDISNRFLKTLWFCPLHTHVILQLLPQLFVETVVSVSLWWTPSAPLANTGKWGWNPFSAARLRSLRSYRSTSQLCKQQEGVYGILITGSWDPGLPPGCMQV